MAFADVNLLNLRLTMVCDEGKLGGGREGSPSKLRTGVSTIGTSSLPTHDVTLRRPDAGEGEGRMRSGRPGREGGVDPDPFG